MSRINNICIKNIWNKFDFNWENLNPDVNILIGINGSGKTTLFNIIDYVIKGDTRRLRPYGVDVNIDISDTLIQYTNKTSPAELKKSINGISYEKISTFDIPNRDKRKISREYSQLFHELYSTFYDIGGECHSFSDYRLKATNFPKEANTINERIRHFFSIVNDMFEKGGKTIHINPKTNHIVFDYDGDEISLEQLSSGEKQLLLILLKVFLMEERKYILLMDEPEISLHIEWQHKLFEKILLLNPNCQIITSTHSPSLFGDGWSDKLIFVEDLISKH